MFGVGEVCIQGREMEQRILNGKKKSSILGRPAHMKE